MQPRFRNFSTCANLAPHATLHNGARLIWSKSYQAVFENEEGILVSTGTPISLMIENTDQRSKDYGEIQNQYRPGHADFTYQNKYGIRDHRGGGRSSARETAMRVAAGGIARQVVPNIKITGALVQMGDLKINYDNWDDAQISQKPIFSVPMQKWCQNLKLIWIKSAKQAHQSAQSIEVRGHQCASRPRLPPYMPS